MTKLSLFLGVVIGWNLCTLTFILLLPDDKTPDDFEAHFIHPVESTADYGNGKRCAALELGVNEEVYLVCYELKEKKGDKS